jgi:hypothetical protein
VREAEARGKEGKGKNHDKKTSTRVNEGNRVRYRVRITDHTGVE